MKRWILVSVLFFGIPISTVYGFEPEAPRITGIDVLIDVGHGGIDGGTKQGSLLEKNINLQIAKELYRSLEKRGIVAALNRTTDMAPSDDNHWSNSASRHLRDLAQRKLLIDQLSPTLVVSLHCNWSPSSRNHGAITMYTAKPQSLVLAKIMQSALNTLYGNENKPRYGKTFYMLNHSPRPIVIIEMGFISNPVDREMLTGPTQQQQLSDVMASAIQEYLLMNPF